MPKFKRGGFGGRGPKGFGGRKRESGDNRRGDSGGFERRESGPSGRGGPGGFRRRESPGGFGNRDSAGFGRREAGGLQRNRPLMHDAVCAKCGQRCEVPFRPYPGKPVYCSNCYQKDESLVKPKKSASLDEINQKLDRILKALNLD